MRRWHSKEDMAIRRDILSHIYAIVNERSRQEKDEIVNISCRLELLLYTNANSLKEYSQISTLRRRLSREAFGIFDVLYEDSNRKRVAEQPFRTAKRRRVSIQSSIFLLNNNEHLIKHIYGFMDASDYVHHQLINRFTADFLPQCVSTMALEVNTARKALMDPLNSLAKYQKLKELVLFNRHTYRFLSSSFATSTSTTPIPPLLPYRSKDRCEDVVCRLASALETGLFPHLTHLSVQSSCINSKKFQSIPKLLRALRSGKHPQLRALDIAGTCAGDDGAVEIANIIRSGQCPKLQMIDARNNFIGERGEEALRLALNSLK